MKRESILRALKIGIAAVVAVGGFALLAALVVRGWNIDDSDVVGSYTAHFNSATERVTLRRDGTYSQEVETEGGQSPVTNSGTWVLSDRDVIFDHCLVLNDGGDDIRPGYATPGTCMYRAERAWYFFGQMRLGSDNPHVLRKAD